MTREPLLEEYDAYALGISEGTELAELRKHLEERCPVCVPAVHESLIFVAGLSRTVKEVNPPVYLRRRVLSMVRDPPSERYGARAPWIAALAVALTLLLVIAFLQHRASLAETQFRQTIDLLSATDLKQVAVPSAYSGNPRADVFVSQSRGVLLVGSGFRPAVKGKTYELWTIAKDQSPIAAGTFTPRDDGTVAALKRTRGADLAAIAVTVEPEGGSDHPTTKPFLVATMP